jgi:proteasome assembly chaperone (PAC2) family protein
VGYLAQAWHAQRFAELDPEQYFDFQATRPHVRLDEGRTRRIDWPETAFYEASVPARSGEVDRDAVLLLGVEPNLRWRTFSHEVVGLAQDLGVEFVVTLGALLADVPHTRPTPVTGTASDERLVEELGLSTSRYEGPTGIVGILQDAFAQSGIRSASLWAAVPHYASLAASPRAAHALCSRLADLLSVEVDLAELKRAGDAYERQVTEAVAADEETEAYVRELERRRDALGPELDLPSGDALAAELTRFLEEHEENRRREDDEA